MQQNSHPGSPTRQLLQRRVKPSPWSLALKLLHPTPAPRGPERRTTRYGFTPTPTLLYFFHISQ